MDQHHLRTALSKTPTDSTEYGIRRWMAEQGHDPARVKSMVTVQVPSLNDASVVHTYVISPTGDDLQAQMSLAQSAAAELEREMQTQDYPWLS